MSPQGSAKEQAAPEPVAIVGMGCRWPGSVRSPSQLWELLKSKREGYRVFTEPRFSAAGFYHPNPHRPGSMATKGGFLLDEDPRLFDNSFFGITNLEAATMDPSQRKLLEVVYEAFENGGESWESISGTRTGVFVGNFSLDHWVIQARDWDNPRPYATTGASPSVLANRISYVFNLQGPSLTVDTACSSSMYAIHMAVNAIRNGDCDSAVVAASNWIVDPGLQIALDKLGALSPTSRCHTFDTSADGYARGEGFAAIYMSKSTLALKNGLPIRAVIRGTAVNSNGRTGGITRPSAAGQEAVIRQAYKNAGDLPLSETTYFEFHGTGTPVGDPIEASAVERVFGPERSSSGQDPLFVGSVKTNLGHTEGASALAAIMKVVLSLEEGVIPPNFGVEKLSPAFEDAKIEVVRDLTPWPKGRSRRASINSFGFGGANGHCIIDHVNDVFPHYMKPGNITYALNGVNSNGAHSNGVGSQRNGGAPAHRAILYPLESRSSVQATTRRLVLLPFSGHNEQSLRMNVDALSNTNRLLLADVAFTLGAKRSKFAKRTFRVQSADDSIPSPSIEAKVYSSPMEPTNIGFVFTGQGAQWDAMGAGLLEYGVFRAAIEYLDHVVSLLLLPARPSWTIEQVISGSCEAGFVHRPEISQTVCTAVQIGLVDLLASWSVRPSGVAGHSSGEMAAAYASGYITAAEAITAAYYRGQAVSKNRQEGAMLAVGIGIDEISKYLSEEEGDSIKIAAINSPNSVTLSGDLEAVERLAELLNANAVFNRMLQTGGNAYHSHHMIPLGHDYYELLTNGLEHIKKVHLVNQSHRYSQVPWHSSVTPAKTLSANDITAAYWRANLESPVRFTEAITNLIDTTSNNIDILVEIGPHGALKSPLDQISKSVGKRCSYTPSLRRGEDGMQSILKMAGALFSLNAQIDLVAVNATENPHGPRLSLVHGCTLTGLPPYQYSYGPVNYYESRASKEYRLRKVIRHDLIGSKVAGTAKLRPQWRNVLRVKDLPWLADHRLVPDVVFPAAGFMSMATASARQVHEEFPEYLSITGYSLRNVSIRTALRIPEDDYGVEVIFAMEISDAASGKSPEWASFSISSVARNSTEWVEHCSGLVKVEVSKSSHPVEMDAPMDSRVADARVWYKTFQKIGLGYGPAFQPLSHIQADPSQGLATAKVALNTTAGTIKGESSYPLHPSALDAAFQLGIIACYGGQATKASTAFVPVHLSELYLNSAIDEDWCSVVAQGDMRGLRSAFVKLQMLSQSGKVVLDIDTLRLTSYSDSKAPHGIQSKAFSSPYTRLVWKPDFRALNERQCRELYPPPEENIELVPLFRTMERIACMIIVDVYQRFAKSENGPQPTGNIGHFFAWIKRRFEQGDTEAMFEAKKLPSDVRLQLIEELYQADKHVVEFTIAKRLHENIEDILEERRTGVDVMIQEGLLTSLYESGLFMTSAYPQLLNMLGGLGHVNPNLNIIEVGAGTGGATRIAIKALVGPNGIKRYRKYTFTDVSPGFLTSAKENMSDIDDIAYSILDIERDPLAQGFEPVYDVVMASQTLHATASISNTLANCRRLLKPGGKLLLVENTRDHLLVGIILGTLTGYWHGIPDGRLDSPFLNLSSWDSALKKAGFSGCELALDDYPGPNNTTTTFLSTRRKVRDDQLGKPIGSNANIQVLLLHGSGEPPSLVNKVSDNLKNQDIASKLIPFDKVVEAVPSNSHIIAFHDGEKLLLDADADGLKGFQYLAGTAASLICLTSCGIAKGRGPDGSLIPGLLRTIGTENPAGRFLSLDIDAEDFEVEDDDLVHCITNLELSIHQDRSNEIDDREFVWQDGCLWVSRFVPDTGLQENLNVAKAPKSHRYEMLPLDSNQAVRAAFETPGVLSSLYFRPYDEMLSPLPADYIDIKVAAVGLNWKDVGLCSGRFDANNLSSEYTGIVTKTGSAVTGLSVGDHVYGMGRGHFGNYTRVPAAFAHKLHPSDDLVEVASMPLVYMTAIYAFDYVTQLTKGDIVLVQSATGGLGLAAIRLAQSKGAEIFAMVGTDEKRRFLVDEMKISSAHVFLSHQTEYMQNVARMLPNGGFDVILSTGSGEMLYNSVKALAPLGHLIDVGRMDVQNAKTMGLELFQKSATFSSFDLSLVLDQSPKLGSKLIQALDRYYRQGKIGLIRPFTVTDISRLDQALIGFSKGTHIGKLIITYQDRESRVKMIAPSDRAQFDTSGCYVITGGLGGLGRSIIRWMCDRGAQNVVVLSRQGINSPEAQALIDSVAKRGIAIRAVICDISKLDEVERAICEVTSERPLKGIVHAAASYLDLSFEKLTIERWQQSLAAKVNGTKNLHQATLSAPLDFFVMITSLESVFALATQSAYTASNNFQDLFARYRRRLGLPASTISFGLINDIGPLSTNPTTIDMFARNKTLTISEHQMLMFLEPAFTNAAASQWEGQDQDPLSAANIITCLDPIRMADKQRDDAEAGIAYAATPRWYSDGRVSLIMRAFDDAQRYASDGDESQDRANGGGIGSVARLRRDFEDSVKAGPSEEERNKTIELVTGAITGAVADMLFIEVSNINPTKTVASHGVDSLIAAELRNWFHEALGANLSMLDLLDAHTSISALAAKIVDGALARIAS